MKATQGGRCDELSNDEGDEREESEKPSAASNLHKRKKTETQPILTAWKTSGRGAKKSQ